jgi:hypothetical protein
VPDPVLKLQNHFIDFDEVMGGLYAFYCVQVILKCRLNIIKVLFSALKSLTHIHIVYIHFLI